MKAVADFYGFQWNGDLEDVFKLWKIQRNPLAHGSGSGENNNLQEMFNAWSRITGTINRFMLAEMGYDGWFQYSPLEAGREELWISKSR